MPKPYVKMRDSLIKRGMPGPKAKTLAAKTYNKNRPAGAKPVTRKGHA